jgi:hypothetical protein
VSSYNKLLQRGALVKVDSQMANSDWLLASPGAKWQSRVTAQLDADGR